LFVRECLGCIAAEDASEGFFQLVVCPPIPLQVGYVVHLHLLGGDSPPLPFIPPEIATTCPILPTQLLGPITSVRARCGDFLYLGVRNQFPGSRVAHVYLRVPWSPG
ncbi:hypothetical protein OH77DRAFT_1387131, partial [Trametes cingulata]